MTLRTGEKVKVRYVVDDETYTLDVEVTGICPPNEFIGRVDAVFRPTHGEITGGHILALKGQEAKFKNDDVLKRRDDQWSGR